MMGEEGGKVGGRGMGGLKFCRITVCFPALFFFFPPSSLFPLFSCVVGKKKKRKVALISKFVSFLLWNPGKKERKTPKPQRYRSPFFGAFSLFFFQLVLLLRKRVGGRGNRQTFFLKKKKKKKRWEVLSIPMRKEIEFFFQTFFFLHTTSVDQKTNFSKRCCVKFVCKKKGRRWQCVKNRRALSYPTNTQRKLWCVASTKHSYARGLCDIICVVYAGSGGPTHSHVGWSAQVACWDVQELFCHCAEYVLRAVCVGRVAAEHPDYRI